MPALLILLAACEGPARFPSPELVGRGVAPTWVWATDPDVGYEVALPGWPTVVRAEDGEIAQLGSTEGPASYAVSVSAPVTVDALDALVEDAGASRLRTLDRRASAITPWDGLAHGRAFFYPDGELRAGIMDGRLVVLSAHGGGEANAAFLRSFAPGRMDPTRVGLPGTDRRLKCPSRCGASSVDLVLDGQRVPATGLAGMVGPARYRAVGARGPGAADAVVAALAGDAFRVEDGDPLRFRSGTDTVLVRVITVGDEAAAASVTAAEPPAWAEGFLRSLE